jgi:hypothetical protein
METIIIIVLILIIIRLFNKIYNQNQKLYYKIINNKNINNKNIKKLDYMYKISVTSNNITSIYNLYSNIDFYKLKYRNYILNIKIIDNNKQEVCNNTYYNF